MFTWFLGLILMAQSGTGVIQGKVADGAETIPFANIVLYQNGVQKGGTTTDIDGKYKFSGLPPGAYDIEVRYVGYNPYIKKGVLVSGDKNTYVDVILTKGINITEVIIEIFTRPLISKDETSTGGTVSREEIAALPTRDVNSIAATTAGVYQADEGGALNVRGGRSDQTEYFIDGIRVRGSLNLPNAAIEQTTVITGGLPSQYGDATSGIISVTTRGASQTFFGGGEILSSQFTDKYGYNLGALNFSGPLITKKDENGKVKHAVLGYFISGEYENNKDPNPSSLGVWQLTEAGQKKMDEHVLRPALGGTGFVQTANFLRTEDFENVARRPNAGSQRMTLQGKLDFQPVENVVFTVGATYDNTSGKNYSRLNSFLNSGNFSDFNNSTFRVYGRFKQSFAKTSKEGEASKSAIQNAFYSLQVDYTKTKSSFENANLGKNAFNYGYHGKLDETITPFYNGGIPGDTLKRSDGTVILNPKTGDTITSARIDAYQVAWGVTQTKWTKGTVDPLLSKYNDDLFFYLNSGGIFGGGKEFLQQFGGYLNGQNPQSVYGIWVSPGNQTAGYGYTDNDLFRLSAQGSADIKGHALKFGIEFDQRTDRSYSVNPFATSLGIWGLARGLTNRHISERDLDNPLFVYNEFNTDKIDSVKFNRLFIAKDQSNFDKNLRGGLGLAPSGTDIIPIDNLDPNALKLQYFNANELLNNGASFVNYFGYDYLGNKSASRQDPLNFFTDTVNRPMASYAPIYTAGYIEDKFDFDDLVFRVGVRVDRFDANQPVLRDPYLLYDAKSANEVDGTLNPLGKHPDGFNKDYVVYVNNENNPTTILGYRNGTTWYDAQGVEIRNPAIIAQSSATGRITPYLREPGVLTMSDGQRGLEMSKAFKDYVPQINVMPRVAFSFPISDEAQFFAHYDVLTQRPPTNFRFNPMQYYYLTNIGGTINNPNLKPERTVDYQIGFKQRVTRTSALSIQAFYRELRNMTQIIPVNFAYPVSYNTYGNIDFGTVKGLEISYDLRRTGNIRMNTSYTLQFADGTGSNAASAGTFVNLGLDGIRTPFALSFDARHRIVNNLDFRYGSGKKYNGPKINGKNILENTGFNIVSNYISGTPYTRQRQITPDGAFGITGRAFQKGDINTSRLPSQFRMNLRIDKDFKFNMGKDGNDKAKTADMNIYLQVQNALNTQNVLQVYPATGSPTDDGFLASPLGEQQLQGVMDQQSFIDLYRIALENPGFYSLPRRIRLGVRFNF